MIVELALESCYCMLPACNHVVLRELRSLHCFDCGTCTAPLEGTQLRWPQARITNSLAASRHACASIYVMFVLACRTQLLLLDTADVECSV
jgi:hypothetical protein